MFLWLTEPTRLLDIDAEADIFQVNSSCLFRRDPARSRWGEERAEQSPVVQPSG